MIERSMDHEAIRAAVRQMVREAVTAHRMAEGFEAPEATDRERVEARHASDGMVRAIAYTLGHTYYAGYDRERATDWRNAFQAIQGVIRSATNSDTYTLDGITGTLLTDHWAGAHEKFHAPLR